MKQLLLVLGLTLFVFGGHIFADANDARLLRYRFKDTPSPTYAVTIQSELPDSTVTESGNIFYTITSVDPSNGQITFTYTAALQTSIQSKDNNGGARPGFPPMPQIPNPFAPQPASPEIMISPLGKVLRSNKSGEDEQLGGMLGLVWQLLLQPLPPNNQQSWTEEQDITLIARVPQQNQDWPRGFPWHQQQQQSERIDRPAHETVNYALGEPNGDLVTIQRQLNLATDEKIGDTPIEKISGDGEYQFNTRSGLVQSLTFKQTIALSENNIAIRVPVTVSAHLLSDEELAKMKAAQEAAEAKLKQDRANAEAQQAQDRQAHGWAPTVANNANDNSAIPDGAVKTEMVGGDGGSPYVKVNPERRDVIGFNIRMGNWANHAVLGQVEPIYDKPTGPAADETTDCLARDGFVVGGIVVCNQDGAAGMQVIFMKKTATGLDVHSAYRSSWYGYALGIKRTLAGNGERVIGTFGRQGLNNDALGLVVENTPESQAHSQEPEAQAPAVNDNPNDATVVNDGPVKTEMVGGNGGGPYDKADPGNRDVIGFSIRLGNWAGHVVLGNVEPLYETPTGPPARRANYCLARAGYVVGGIIVDEEDNCAAGMQVIFIKKTATGLDRHITYRSPWYGYTVGSKHVLAGNGEHVIGTFGRQGMNMDALGLIVEPAKPAPARQ